VIHQIAIHLIFIYQIVIHQIVNQFFVEKLLLAIVSLSVPGARAGVKPLALE
jgi:hypothetical protein